MKSVRSSEFARCYKLERHIKLQLDRQAALIYSTFPLFVTKTTPRLIEILRRCDGQTSVAELARPLKLKPASVLKALEELHSRGFLQIEVAKEVLEDEALPEVSVIVPVYNRPADLERCLDALLKLDYSSAKLEIIVVDDASTDGTGEVAARYPVRLLHNSTQLGPAGSRNRAIEVAAHELIACVDSDCVVAPNWLRELAALFADEQIAAAGGATRAAYINSPLERYEAVRSSLFMGERPAEVRLQGSLSYLPTCNLIFRRSVYREVGGFDPALRFGEDVDFCWRVLKAGWRIRYHPAAQLAHAYRADWGGFLKTRRDYASSEAPLVARHPDKHRTLYLPLWEGLAWAGVFTALSSRKIWPLGFSLTLPLVVGWRKWGNLRGYALPLGLEQVLMAEYRSYTVAGYHLGTHSGKYYSLPLLVGLLPRRTRLATAIILTGPVIADYVRCKPRLNLPMFVMLSLVENLFYQFGVALGCLREKKLTALIPRLRIQK